jgi:hypothetical protein
MATRELQPPTDRPPDGVGFFACKGCLCDVARVPDTPFGDPYPHRLTGLPLPHFPPSVPPTLTDWMAKGWGTGQWMATGGAGIFFALTPTTLLEWGDVLLGLLL